MLAIFTTVAVFSISGVHAFVGGGSVRSVERNRGGPSVGDYHSLVGQRLFSVVEPLDGINAAEGADTEEGRLRVTAIAPPKSLRTVIKFGGSSLATAKRLFEVANLVKALIEQGQRPTMVCSAMGKTTNNLLSAGKFALRDGKVYIDAIRTLHISACDELGLGEHTKAEVEDLLDDLRSMLEGVGMLRELTPRSKDRLVSFGERMSVRLMAATLNKLGVPAQHFDAWVLGMRTTGDFGRAEILPATYPAIKETLSKFDPSMVAVVTGYLGQSSENEITTLGRGGSDLSATVIGVACGADEVQVNPSIARTDSTSWMRSSSRNSAGMGLTHVVRNGYHRRS